MTLALFSYSSILPPPISSFRPLSSFSTSFFSYFSARSFIMRPCLRLLTRTANYPGHIPLSRSQNALLAVGSGVVGVLDVTRGDLIASLSESTAGIFLPALHEKMKITPEGRQIMKDRPEITNKTIEKLKELKRGTLGREYVEWLGDGGLEPESRAPVSLLTHFTCRSNWSLLRSSGTIHRFSSLSIYNASLPPNPRSLPHPLLFTPHSST